MQCKAGMVVTGPVAKKLCILFLFPSESLVSTNPFVVVCLTQLYQLSKRVQVIFLSFAFEIDLGALQLQVLILKDQRWMCLLPYFWSSLILNVVKTLCDVSVCKFLVSQD